MGHNIKRYNNDQKRCKMGQNILAKKITKLGNKALELEVRHIWDYSHILISKEGVVDVVTNILSQNSEILRLGSCKYGNRILTIYSTESWFDFFI